MTLPYTLHLGDCLEVLRSIPDNSIDSIVTDPPYGLSREPDMTEVLRHWLAGDDYQHQAAGFMGKTWDSFVPGPAVWRECLRALKPGGHLLAFFGTRTQDIGTLAIRLAGFEIRDSIAWVYGSGFPKSRNIAALDMTGEDAERWEGWGTALKPALEPIVVARKPLAGTVAQNVLTHGTGALNIDACRIPSEPMARNTGAGGLPRRREDEKRGPGVVSQPHADGRWPANLIHDGSDEVLAAFPDAPGQLADASLNTESRKTQNVYGAMRRCREGEASANSENGGVVGFSMRPGMRRIDTGTAARFFYCAKASRTDRSEGCDQLPRRQGGMVSNTRGQHLTRRDGYEPPAVGNHHPTVKPTDLMAYLLRLVTPPGGLTLDPFMGSGSTGKAAMREGFRFIGIERDQDENGQSLGYLAIAEARIAHELKRVTTAAAEAAKGSAQLDIFHDTKEPAA
jgi:site-specific DNA-methyltransferase (adenine-specific)